MIPPEGEEFTGCAKVLLLAAYLLVMLLALVIFGWLVIAVILSSA